MWFSSVKTVGMTVTSVDERMFDVGETVAPAGRVEEQRAPADKTFLPYDMGQPWLMPPSLADWLPEDHLARVVDELVEHTLDLSQLRASYVEERGAPPYDPRMMLKLLLYGYATGVCSSREIERRCHVDVGFRYLAANATPDYRSIARFRRRQLGAVKDLFTQVLAVCKRAGLVKLGRVALDGTKLRANASRHKAMSYERMVKREAELAAEIVELEAQAAALLDRAEATDTAEDGRYGADRRGDELPAELARRVPRLAKIRAAKADLEREAAEAAAERVRAKARKEAENEAPQAATGRDTPATPGAVEPAPADAAAADAPVGQDPPGTADQGAVGQVTPADTGTGTVEPADAAAGGQDPPGGADEGDAGDDDPADDPAVEAAARAAAAAARPKPTAQRNFTDPESRIMKTSDRSFHQCYNAQAIVDEANQIIVATALTNQAADAPHLPAMLEQLQGNLGATPSQLLADAGYFSANNVDAAIATGVDPLIATGRFKHNEPQPPAPGGPVPEDVTPKQRMGRKLRTEAGRAAYARRKAIVEPVFGQMQTRQDAKRLLLRGQEAAEAEWTLHSLCHNVLKLFTSRCTSRAAIA